MTQDNPQNVDPDLWKMAKQRVEFKTHLTIFMIVIPFLWAIWALTSYRAGGFNIFPWPIWPTLGWGLGIVFNYLFVYVFPDGGNSKKAIQKEYEKISGKY